ncbi:MAG TPA: YceI family protein [Fimbriimonas sp.]|nr:YceI family protein [Fimbriimonas sp.]
MDITALQQGTHSWNVDPSHSSISFSVRHMGIFTVRGSLGTISGTVTTTDAVLSKISLSIDATGISTNNEQRDTHLKSADFLNVEAHPSITFESTAVAKKSESEYTVTGDLTIAGKTHPATFDVEIVPPVKDPWGMIRAGATGSSKIKRTDWGIHYNTVLETGHVLVGEDVHFTFDVQAVAAGD